MCYAIPGRVIDIQNNIATIDYFGEKKSAYIDTDIRVDRGDYVFAQGGIIVQMVSDNEAMDMLEGWEEIFSRLREKDRKLAERTIRSGFPDTEIEDILERAEEGKPISRDGLIRILKCRDSVILESILGKANSIRQRAHGNSCCVHGIIEFSNICKNDCAYCGIRSDNINLKRYRMETDSIVDTAVDAVRNLGFKAIVFQSGEDGSYTTERLAEIIRKIRKRCSLLIILSTGERDEESYRALYTAGARGVLLRFETSNPALYRGLHSILGYDRRLELLKSLKDMGYIVATGSIIGLPGQSEGDIADDILLATALGADMFSFGPLLPHPDTPLSASPVVDIETFLKVLAVTRLLNQRASILVTSAAETLFGHNGLKRGLMGGGNSLMVNLTPPSCRELYSIYPGKGRLRDTNEEIKQKLALLYSLGRAPADIGIVRRYAR